MRVRRERISAELTAPVRKGRSTVEQILDRLLNPAVAWVLIPLAALICWGIGNIIRALRGGPADMEEVQAELHDLRMTTPAHARQLLRERLWIPYHMQTGGPGGSPFGFASRAKRVE
jgi:hypothetical protein